ncbi:hypothetical protein DY000_02002374 [Brassica cretica]|uniref:Uncharacterized protein n=1 Tax=Brassica cretica TaxID=69181 RepID=A0ABQ7BXA3_BRACR|nr:hypothetical protein DY000_02002374 [Brassica cretica]
MRTTLAVSARASGLNFRLDEKKLKLKGVISFPLHGSFASSETRASSSSVAISKAVQKFEDANTEKLELAITNTFIALPWKANEKNRANKRLPPSCPHASKDGPQLRACWKQYKRHKPARFLKIIIA